MHCDISMKALLLVPLLALGACRTPSIVFQDTGTGGGDVAGGGDDGGSGSGSGSGDDTGCEQQTWYLDDDADGYGDEAVEDCEQPDGTVEISGDCNDDDASVNPAAKEICNGKDDDCDGSGDPSSCEPGNTGFDEEVSLSDADAKLWAPAAGYDAGRKMDVGDVTGDGVGDLLVGAMWANGYQGGAFLVPGPIEESSSLSDAGYWLRGGPGAYEGARSLGVAEATGDGYADIYLGSPDASVTDVVVFFGPIVANSTFPEANIVLSCTGPIECGHGGDLTDVSGDGYADLIIGAAEEINAGANSGSLYFLFGPLTDRESTVQEAAEAELRSEGAGLETGRKVAAGGDMNGDGIGDIIATATYDSTAGLYAGAVYVMHGPFEGLKSFAEADGKWLGEKSEDYAGEAITMGDIDGDGLSDAIIGSYLNSRYNGAVYVATGPATGIQSMGDAEIVVRGLDKETLGTAVAAGDMDGDGVDELLVGAASNDISARDAGAAYLFVDLVAGTWDTSQAPTTFLGEASGNAAGDGAHIGDIDGDGEAEVFIGATAENTGGNAAGAAYVLHPSF